jgi:hypothetical protein
MTNQTATAQGILQLVPTDTLAAVLAGEVDLNALARREMAGRGLDATGQWVGFEAAKALLGA